MATNETPTSDAPSAPGASITSAPQVTLQESKDHETIRLHINFPTQGHSFDLTNHEDIDKFLAAVREAEEQYEEYLFANDLRMRNDL